MFFATKREGLDDEQQDFLRRLVPWSFYLCNQTKLKARFFKGVPFNGVLPSVSIADIGIQSDWGRHPIAGHTFHSKDANNLALLPVDEVWEGSSLKYKAVNYKTFNNWQTFFVHYSDLLVFDRNKNQIIRTVKLEDQLKAISHTRPTLKLYNEKLESLIQQYDLTEFDFNVPDGT